MFNSAQIHLAFNHFPIAGMFLTIFLLGIGLFFKKKELILSGMLIAIVSGIAIVPMSLSGEGAQEIIKEKPGVIRELIHEHEEMGEKALIIFLITAVVSLSWFIISNRKPSWSNKIVITTFVLSFISAIIIAQTAHLGGMIRHDELRNEKIK